MNQTLVSVFLAAAVGAVVLVLVRREAPTWLVVAMLALPAMVLLGDFQRQQISAHGFFHASIAYSIHERGLPAEHPLLAGQLLRYPHLHHWLVAIGCAALRLPPGTLFGISGLLSLLVFGAACDYAARQLDPRSGYRILVILLAVAGSAIFSRGPLAILAGRAQVITDGRLLPWLKFTGVNSNHLGLVFSAIALAALLRSGHRFGVLPLGALAAAALGAGLLYPMSLLVIVVWTACFAGIEVWQRGRAAWGRALALGLSATTGIVLALPYLLSVAAGRPAAGTLQVAPSLDYILRHAAILATTLALPAAILWAGRGVLRDLSRRQPRNVIAVASCACATSALYVFGFMSPLTAYKAPLAGMLPVALLAALPLLHLCQRRWWLATAALALVLLPLASVVADWWLRPWPASERVTRNGMNLLPVDPAEAELQSFLAAATPPRAAIVDTRPTAAPFAHRALFVAPAEIEVPGRRDGWGMSADLILGAVTGADPEVVTRRRALAAALLAPGGTPPDSSLLAALHHEAGTDVYFVVRQAETRERLAGNPGLREVFSSPTASVLRLE